jgi:hypothetical protein
MLSKLQALSRAHQILLAGGVVLFVDMFFTWQGVNLLGTTVGVSGWHGFLGFVLGLATIAVVGWEVLLLLGDQTAEIRRRVPLAEQAVPTILAAAVAVLGILKFLSANELRRWPEWVGVVLALAIGYGGWQARATRAAGAADAPAETPVPTE